MKMVQCKRVFCNANWILDIQNEQYLIELNAIQMWNYTITIEKDQTLAFDMTFTIILTGGNVSALNCLASEHFGAGVEYTSSSDNITISYVIENSYPARGFMLSFRGKKNFCILFLELSRIKAHATLTTQILMFKKKPPKNPHKNKNKYKKQERKVTCIISL